MKGAHAHCLKSNIPSGEGSDCLKWRLKMIVSLIFARIME